MTRCYRIKDLARATGVSTRALRHYDAIGLLCPRRTENGYRLYTADDFLRLQQILIQRALGLPLEEIARTLDDPGFDRKAALLRQRAALEERAQSARRMIAAIDHALAVLSKETTMTAKDLFDGFDPVAYEAEAKERWGATGAYKESARRTKTYTEDDWRRLKGEQSAIYRAAAEALAAGLAPGSAAACRIAENHRLLIDRWFYPCSRAMHMGLADLYEGDARFAANIDTFGPGLTAFLSAAIRANGRG